MKCGKKQRKQGIISFLSDKCQMPVLQVIGVEKLQKKGDDQVFVVTCHNASDHQSTLHYQLVKCKSDE